MRFLFSDQEEYGPLVYLYRYEDSPNADPADYTLLAFRVLRLTPKGAWINVSSWGEPKERWVPLTRHPGAHYAFVSPEQAIYSYKCRKEWHVRRLRHKLDQAQQRLTLATAHCTTGTKPKDDSLYNLPLMTGAY